MVSRRLVLSAIGVGDVAELVVLYSDPEVARWTGPWDRGRVERWARDMGGRWAADGVGKWIAHDKATGSLVGRGGFTQIGWADEPVMELGWVVRDALTGHGYAQEMGRAALDWAAEHRPEWPIVAFTEVHNHASRAVMERLGMRFAEIIHREGLVQDRVGLHPDAPFALYRA